MKSYQLVLNTSTISQEQSNVTSAPQNNPQMQFTTVQNVQNSQMRNMMQRSYEQHQIPYKQSQESDINSNEQQFLRFPDFAAKMTPKVRLSAEIPHMRHEHQAYDSLGKDLKASETFEGQSVLMQQFQPGSSSLPDSALDRSLDLGTPLPPEEAFPSQNTLHMVHEKMENHGQSAIYKQLLIQSPPTESFTKINNVQLESPTTKTMGNGLKNAPQQPNLDYEYKGEQEQEIGGKLIQIRDDRQEALEDSLKKASKILQSLDIDQIEGSLDVQNMIQAAQNCDKSPTNSGLKNALTELEFSQIKMVENIILVQLRRMFKILQQINKQASQGNSEQIITTEKLVKTCVEAILIEQNDISLKNSDENLANKNALKNQSHPKLRERISLSDLKQVILNWALELNLEQVCSDNILDLICGAADYDKDGTISESDLTSYLIHIMHKTNMQENSSFGNFQKPQNRETSQLSRLQTIAESQGDESNRYDKKQQIQEVKSKNVTLQDSTTAQNANINGSEKPYQVITTSFGGGGSGETFRSIKNLNTNPDQSHKIATMATTNQDKIILNSAYSSSLQTEMEPSFPHVASEFLSSHRNNQNINPNQVANNLAFNTDYSLNQIFSATIQDNHLQNGDIKDKQGKNQSSTGNKTTERNRFESDQQSVGRISDVLKTGRTSDHKLEQKLVFEDQKPVQEIQKGAQGVAPFRRITKLDKIGSSVNIVLGDPTSPSERENGVKDEGQTFAEQCAEEVWTASPKVQIEKIVQNTNVQTPSHQSSSRKRNNNHLSAEGRSSIIQKQKPTGLLEGKLRRLSVKKESNQKEKIQQATQTAILVEQGTNPASNLSLDPSSKHSSSNQETFKQKGKQVEPVDNYLSKVHKLKSQKDTDSVQEKHKSKQTNEDNKVEMAIQEQKSSLPKNLSKSPQMKYYQKKSVKNSINEDYISRVVEPKNAAKQLKYFSKPKMTNQSNLRKQLLQSRKRPLQTSKGSSNNYSPSPNPVRRKQHPFLDRHQRNASTLRKTQNSSSLKSRPDFDLSMDVMEIDKSLPAAIDWGPDPEPIFSCSSNKANYGTVQTSAIVTLENTFSPAPNNYLVHKIPQAQNSLLATDQGSLNEIFHPNYTQSSTASINLNHRVADKPKSDNLPYQNIDIKPIKPVLFDKKQRAQALNRKNESKTGIQKKIDEKPNTKSSSKQMSQERELSQHSINQIDEISILEQTMKPRKLSPLFKSNKSVQQKLQKVIPRSGTQSMLDKAIKKQEKLISKKVKNGLISKKDIPTVPDYFHQTIVPTDDQLKQSTKNSLNIRNQQSHSIQSMPVSRHSKIAIGQMPIIQSKQDGADSSFMGLSSQYVDLVANSGTAHSSLTDQTVAVKVRHSIDRKQNYRNEESTASPPQKHQFQQNLNKNGSKGNFKPSIQPQIQVDYASSEVKSHKLSAAEDVIRKRASIKAQAILQDRHLAKSFLKIQRPTNVLSKSSLPAKSSLEQKSARKDNLDLSEIQAKLKPVGNHSRNSSKETIKKTSQPNLSQVLYKSKPFVSSEQSQITNNNLKEQQDVRAAKSQSRLNWGRVNEIAETPLNLGGSSKTREHTLRTKYQIVNAARSVQGPAEHFKNVRKDPNTHDNSGGGHQATRETKARSYLLMESFNKKMNNASVKAKVSHELLQRSRGGGLDLAKSSGGRGASSMGGIGLRNSVNAQLASGGIVNLMGKQMMQQMSQDYQTRHLSTNGGNRGLNQQFKQTPQLSMSLQRSVLQGKNRHFRHQI